MYGLENKYKITHVSFSPSSCQQNLQDCLDETGNTTELHVSWLAKPAADMLSDFIFGFTNVVQYYLQNLRYSQRTVRIVGGMRCDAIPSHSNTTQNADTPSGAATSRCNWTSINPTPTVAYVSLQSYFPTFISVGRHRSHKTIVRKYFTYSKISCSQYPNSDSFRPSSETSQNCNVSSQLNCTTLSLKSVTYVTKQKKCITWLLFSKIWGN